MRINIDKTKTMVFSKRSIQQVGNTKLNNIIIEEVSSSVYFGSKLTWDNDSMEKIKRGIQLATGAYSGLKIVWKDIRLETKVLQLQTCVFSVLYYMRLKLEN
jgi:hypothetical protein